MTDVPRQLDISTAVTDFASLRRRLDIFVDGERMSRVLSYDIDKGTVTRVAIGPDGVLILDHDLGLPKTETIYGKVAVSFREPARA